MWLILLKVKYTSFVKQLKQQLNIFDDFYQSNLEKMLGLLLCLKLDVCCLLAVTCAAKVNVVRRWLWPPKRVSPRAGCPKSQQHIRASVWSATLWTRLSQELLSFPQGGDTRTHRGGHKDGWQPLWAPSPTVPCPSCLSLPTLARGGVGISVSKYSICYERPSLLCFLHTRIRNATSTSEWIGNNWGICWWQLRSLVWHPQCRALYTEKRPEKPSAHPWMN